VTRKLALQPTAIQLPSPPDMPRTQRVLMIIFEETFMPKEGFVELAELESNNIWSPERRGW